MSFRSSPVGGFERLEAANIDSFESALNSALDLLEQRGMNGANTEPEVTIVIRNTLPGADGTRLVNSIVYIGATSQDIATDLNKKI